MNLQELKDEYAIEKGFESWEDIICVTIGENENFLACDKIIEYELEVEVLIQKQALKNASGKTAEMLEMIEELIHQFEDNNNSSQEVDLLNEAKKLIKQANEL